MSNERISRMIAEARLKPGEDVEAIRTDTPEYIRIRNNDLGSIDVTVVSGVINGITFSVEIPDGCANVELLAVQIVQAVRESGSLPALTT